MDITPFVMEDGRQFQVTINGKVTEAVDYDEPKPSDNVMPRKPIASIDRGHLSGFVSAWRCKATVGTDRRSS